ncbi:uncharacterized protein LOC129584660 [Paramacrobiotus metropolitanus]|uniref:uncharacterized protein LOC129584660 n=1 Tax=Paramacrobiotus metropolitanus TaxID=2943436 RepID=UPI002445767B|nr:uncharacterized protein LOC129584660 [Paramacrobiotus metropolitanus]
MDDIGEFLKVPPLNGYPPLKPREPLAVKSTNSDSTPAHYVTLQPHLPINAIDSQTFDSFFSSPISTITPNQSVFTMSGGGFSHQAPEPTYTVLAPTSSAFPRVAQNSPAVTSPSWSPTPVPPSPTSRTEYSMPAFFDSMPIMPTLTDHQDEDGISVSGEGEDGVSASLGSKGDRGHRKGRQRVDSGPLSAHAVYARMNRERKKKYLADLEKYRTVMRKKHTEGQRELEQIQKESQLLTEEISRLRSILTGNKTLMALLSMGHRPKV